MKEDETPQGSERIIGIWRIVASVIASTKVVSIPGTIPETQHSSAGEITMTKPQRDERGRFLPKKRPGMIVALRRDTLMMWLPTEKYPEGVLRISCDYPMPNVWYRFWGRFLLGVRWKYVDVPDA